MLAAPVSRKVGLDATQIGIYRNSISLDWEHPATREQGET